MRKRLYAFTLIVLLGLFMIACGSSTDGGNHENNEDNQAQQEEKNNNHNNNGEENIVIIEDEEEGTLENPLQIDVVYPWGEDQFNNRFKPIEERMGNVEIIYHW